MTIRRDTTSTTWGAAPRTPAEALRALEAGNERFARGEMAPRDVVAEVAATAGGQSPFAIVLGCDDSRVPPEIVFDQGIGSIVVARVAGNFANTDIIGSLEFGTKTAGAKLVVVLGHSECAAVRAACDDVRLGNFTRTLGGIMPAVYAVDGDGDRSARDAAFAQRVAEKNVELTVEALCERSAIMRELVELGKLRIAGAMYDTTTGRVAFIA